MSVDSSQASNSDLNDDNLLENYKSFINKYPPLNYPNNFNNEIINQYIIKDNVFDINYIISSPIIILDSKNYKPYGNINIIRAHFDLIFCKKFFGFISDNDFFFCLYSNKDIFIYPLSKNNNNNNKSPFYFEFNLIDNNNYENIIKIQYILNELNQNYFMIITNLNKYYFFQLKYDYNNNSFNFFIEEYEINKGKYLNFWPFNFNSNNNNYNNNENENIFILNPFSYNKLLRGYSPNNNNLNNSLIVFSLNFIKIFSFTLSNNLIIPQIIFNDDKIMNKINNSLKIENEIANNILCCDCYFDKKNNIISIFLVLVTFNNNFYLFKIDVGYRNGSIDYDVFKLNISQYYANNNNFNNTFMIINKFNNEGIIIIENCIIFKFYENYKSIKNFPYEIIGFNSLISPQRTDVDIFTLNYGIKGVYDDINNEIKIKNKNNVFLSQFNMALEPIKLNNDYYNYNNNENNINENDNNENLIKNLNNNIINQKFVNFDLNKNNLTNETQKNLVNFINYELNNYLINKSNNKNYIPTESFKNNFYDKINNFPKNSIINSINYIIDNIINNDSLNIELIDKSSAPAEYVIYDYLQNKFKYLDNICEFFYSINFFDNFKDLEEKIYNYLEKLIITKNIRNMENQHYKNYNKIDQNNKEKFELIKKFLDNFYEKMKNYLNFKYKNIPFSKQLLFGKLENITNEFLYNYFKEFINIIENKNEIDYENKENLLIYMIATINNINDDIKELYKKYKSFGNLIIKNNFWFNFIKNSNENNNNENINIDNDNNINNNNKDILLKIYLKTFDIINNNNSNIKFELLNSFANDLLYFYQLYFNKGNNSSFHKKEFFNKKKNIINNLINFNKNEAFNLAKNYKDYYNLSYIYFIDKNNFYDELINYLKNPQINKNDIKLILTIILKFEVQNINNNNNILFDYFDRFYEFDKNIFDVVCKYPKILNYFFLYINSKNLSFIDKKNYQNNLDIQLHLINNKKDNLINISKIEKIQNLIGYSNFKKEYFYNLSNESNYVLLVQYLANNYGLNLNLNKYNNFYDCVYDLIDLINTKNEEDIKEKYLKISNLLFTGLNLKKINYNEDKFKDIFEDLFIDDFKNLNNLIKYKRDLNDEISFENMSDSQRQFVLESSIYTFIFERFDFNLYLIKQIIEKLIKNLKEDKIIEIDKKDEKKFYDYLLFCMNLKKNKKGNINERFYNNLNNRNEIQDQGMNDNNFEESDSNIESESNKIY